MFNEVIPDSISCENARARMRVKDQFCKTGVFHSFAVLDFSLRV